MKKRPTGSRNKQQEQTSPGNNLPTPSRLTSEKMMRDIQRVLQGRNFSSMEEANAFLGSLTGKGLEEALLNAEPLPAKERAQQLAFDAMEADTAARAHKLARRALGKDPGCVDALVVVAEIESKSPQEMITALEKAVAMGEHSLGTKFFSDNNGDFWGRIETRPYMRARLRLAELLRALDRHQEAIRQYEGLLQLNPNDNQGVRYILLGCYLAVDDLQGAQRLFRQNKDDDSAVFAWVRSLERFLANDLQGAGRELKIARKRNRYVELYFGGQRKIGLRASCLPCSECTPSGPMFKAEIFDLRWQAH